MAKASELDRLLSLVVFDSRLNVVEGLTEFRDLLDDDGDGKVLSFLKWALDKLEGRCRSGIAFVIAERAMNVGDSQALRKLIAIDDAQVRAGVLNALWGKPSANPQLGPDIVEMAVLALKDDSPEVRTAACSVIQNQCGWKVDVTDAIEPLESLLNDPNDRVRHQAAYAVGNLAKGRYGMSRCIPQLRKNTAHKNMYVRDANAKALWQLSRSKHEITAAVPDLVRLLTSTEEYSEDRKQAAGALLHHARKSPANAKTVQKLVATVTLDLRQKEIKRFVKELAELV